MDDNVFDMSAFRRPAMAGLGDATTAATTVATAAAQGGVNIGSDVAAALSVLSIIGASPSKQNYDNVFKPNAQKVVAAYGTNFVSGCEAAGWDTEATATALSGYLQLMGTTLTPAQCLADGTPAPAATATGDIGTTISNAVSSLSSSGVMPYVLLGGGALVLLLLLRK